MHICGGDSRWGENPGRRACPVFLFPCSSGELRRTVCGPIRTDGRTSPRGEAAGHSSTCKRARCKPPSTPAQAGRAAATWTRGPSSTGGAGLGAVLPGQILLHEQGRQPAVWGFPHYRPASGHPRPCPSHSVDTPGRGPFYGLSAPEPPFLAAFGGRKPDPLRSLSAGWCAASSAEGAAGAAASSSTWASRAGFSGRVTTTAAAPLVLKPPCAPRLSLPEPGPGSIFGGVSGATRASAFTPPSAAQPLASCPCPCSRTGVVCPPAGLGSGHHCHLTVPKPGVLPSPLAFASTAKLSARPRLHLRNVLMLFSAPHRLS